MVTATIWNNVEEGAWILGIIGYYFVVAITIISLLLSNRNPVKTLSYIIVLITMPVIGLVVYYFLGQDYRKSKLFSRKGIIDNELVKRWEENQQYEVAEHELFSREYLGDAVKIARQLYRNNYSVLTIRNEIEILKNGESKIPALKRELEKATRYIYMEYYIIDEDEIGISITDLLMEKAAEGVEVKVIIDDLGSSDLSSARIKKMREAGVQIFPFMPVRFPKYSNKLNFRDHRKIVVIDGLTGFVGGINLAKRYVNDGKRTYWRDTHLLIRGEAVKSLQIVFMLNWKFVTGSVPVVHSNFYKPAVEIKSNRLAQVAFSGPDSDWASILLAFFTAITNANYRVLLQSPYFIPSEELMTAMISAAQAGVDVQLMLPRNSDARITNWAAQSYFERLLEAGVKILLYTKGFLHAKAIIVDDVFCSVGTANLDYRSFNTNFEVNCMLYDRSLNKQLAAHFEEDARHCQVLDFNRWKQRPVSLKIAQSLARLLSPLL